MVDVRSSDTILNVKERIEAISGLKVQYQELIYAGKLEKLSLLLRWTVVLCDEAQLKVTALEVTSLHLMLTS